MKDMMEAFVRYAKEQFGCNISLEKSLTPDTFESLFGTGLIEKEDDDIFLDGVIVKNISYKNNIAGVSNMETIYKNTIDSQQDITLAA